jgi:hypothetical protein
LPRAAQVVSILGSYSSISVKISEKGVAGAAAHQSIVTGNNQTAPINTTLPKALTVKVVDQFGNSVSGVTVNYSDGGAGGTLSAPSAVTNGSGQASVTYKTPSTKGLLAISASVAGTNSLTFNVRVQ